MLRATDREPLYTMSLFNHCAPNKSAMQAAPSNIRLVDLATGEEKKIPDFEADSATLRRHLSTECRDPDCWLCGDRLIEEKNEAIWSALTEEHYALDRVKALLFMRLNTARDRRDKKATAILEEIMDATR